MEIIKRKICLEQFKSRIPSLIETVDILGVSKTKHDGSWGEMPKPVTVLGVEMKYGTMMELYHSVLRIVMNAKVKEYDKLGDKWISLNYDWRNIINDTTRKVSFVTSTPTRSLVDKQLISFVYPEDEFTYYSNIRNIFGEDKCGLDLINAVHELIGKITTPATFIGTHVPYFLYLSDVDDIISFLEDLKIRGQQICCERKRYLEYGGDGFLNYLKSLTIPTVTPLTTNITIDIPILLTSTLLDMGIFKSYDVEEVIEDENGEPLVFDVDMSSDICEYCGQLKDTGNHDNCHPRLVITSGESKLRTLRKRRRSFDDEGKELPGILDDGKITLPYQPGYVKNKGKRREDNSDYGDVIYAMNEFATSKESTKEQYLSIKEMAKIKTNGNGFLESSNDDGWNLTPIEGLKQEDITCTKEYGNIKKEKSDAEQYAQSTYFSLYDALVIKMCKLLDIDYPTYYCYKQDYKYTFNVTYGIDGGNGEREEVKDVITYSGTTYVVANDVEMEIIYVLGGKLKTNGDKLELDEISPFSLDESEYDTWDGSGIWYRERLPLKKMCVQEFLIDGQKKQYIYDVIDFSKKETTYTFNGIDFPRKNYILCEDIRYKSTNHNTFFTHKPAFRDDKMLSLSSPLKEKYDVIIDRGISSAFERHLQLSEVKSWNDLENYRNGMFLNK